MTRLHLTLDERVFMLRVWIHPVVAWVSKAYFPTALVVSQLKLVHTVAMGTKSWGIIVKQLSHNREHGGRGFLTPEAFLWYHVAFPFVHWVHRSYDCPSFVTDKFRC